MVVGVGSLFFSSCISFGDRIGIGDSVSDRLLSFILLSFIYVSFKVWCAVSFLCFVFCRYSCRINTRRLVDTCVGLNAGESGLGMNVVEYAEVLSSLLL